MGWCWHATGSDFGSDLSAVNGAEFVSAAVTAKVATKHKAATMNSQKRPAPHAGATLAAQTGATTKELMARLGRASPRAALIYQHAAQDRDQTIADQLDRLVQAHTDAGDRNVARDGRAMER